MAYSSGVGATVVWTPSGGSPFSAANFTWKQKETTRKAEVTNALTGAVAAWIAGVADISGSFDVVWDGAATPEGAQLKKGVSGAIAHAYGLSGHTDTTLLVLIENVEKQVDVRNGAIVYKVDWVANGVSNTVV